MADRIRSFCRASSLGFARQLSGSFAPGFLIFAGLALLAFAGLRLARRRWRATRSSGARI